MPGGDRTGPMGMGPKTGWGAGYCSGTGIPGDRNQAASGKSWFEIKGGFGPGRGSGRRRQRHYQQVFFSGHQRRMRYRGGGKS